MNFKSFLLLLFIISSFTSCRDNETTTTDDNPIESETKFPPTPMEISRNDTVTAGNETRQPHQSSGSATQNQDLKSLTGKYIKQGRESETCECYCLDLTMDEVTELCLVENEMYINTRMEKNQDNTFNFYYIEPSRRNQNTQLPWQDFDRNEPIARLVHNSNDELEMDWLGFTINGDLAMDYAIFGKKSLEGTYKRK